MKNLSFKNFAGSAIGVTAAVIAIWIIPKWNAETNGLANLDQDQIRGAWFIPAGKTESDIVWLDNSSIRPLYQLLASQTVEDAPAKWVVLGRVGFTYANGRNAGVELYDTRSNRGAFKFGKTYFRYEGDAGALIDKERKK